jgi:hypothetical protein
MCHQHAHHACSRKFIVVRRPLLVYFSRPDAAAKSLVSVSKPCGQFSDPHQIRPVRLTTLTLGICIFFPVTLSLDRPPVSRSPAYGPAVVPAVVPAVAPPQPLPSRGQVCWQREKRSEDAFISHAFERRCCGESLTGWTGLFLNGRRPQPEPGPRAPPSTDPPLCPHTAFSISTLSSSPGHLITTVGFPTSDLTCTRFFLSLLRPSRSKRRRIRRHVCHCTSSALHCTCLLPICPQWRQRLPPRSTATATATTTGPQNGVVP